MKSTSPIPPGRPTQRTPDAWALQAEWRGEPPTLAREEAGRALDALGRSAEEAAGGGADDVPPVPEELRARWAEAYGRPAEEPNPSRSVDHRRGDREKRTFSGWLAELLTPRRLVWAGGAGAAAAAVLALFFQSGDLPTGASGFDGDRPSVRGGGAGAAVDAAPIAVVVPAAARETATGVLENLQVAFPGRVVHVLNSADQAAAMAQREPRLVVINLGSGLVAAWISGALADEFPTPPGTPSDRVIPQVESADERLERGDVVAP